MPGLVSPIKPPLWNISPRLVASEWQWAWRLPAFIIGGWKGCSELVQKTQINTQLGTWTASKYGIGFDTSGTAGDRIGWGDSSPFNLAGGDPFSIFVAFADFAGWWGSGGVTNLFFGRNDDSGNGYWDFRSINKNDFSFTYKRVGGTNISVDFIGGAPETATALRTLVLVREKTSTPDSFRLYLDGVDQGTSDPNGGLGPSFISVGSQSLSAGATAAQPTRGVKAKFLSAFAIREIATIQQVKQFHFNPVGFLHMADDYAAWRTAAAPGGSIIPVISADYRMRRSA